MPQDLNLLGVDVGSVSVSVAEIDGNLEIVHSVYAFHKGEPRRCLDDLLKEFDLSSIGGIACASSTPPLVNSEGTYDDLVCLMTACRHLHGKVGSILVVGGEKFGLIRFDPQGNYLSYRGNTSCAAGTGSFLDQQALRLRLKGIEELSSVASGNQGDRPQIASRCAVFAKTDLVHAQQEGYTVAGICDGLCYGLAKNIVDTVVSGTKPLAPIVFVGGVSLNSSVVRHLESLLGEKLIVDGNAAHGALGAALMLHRDLPPAKRRPLASSSRIFLTAKAQKECPRAPLRLEKSEYPDFQNIERFLFTPRENRENPVEVELYQPVRERDRLELFLGIDIGSTSTKAVLLDTRQQVVVGLYTRTCGKPLDATRNILAAIEDLREKHRAELHFLGAATTGSGRKFVGKVIGADLVLNEISAHARAAVHANPSVDTIIEIGGQDSKFTVLRNGMVTSCVMNTVCAAGTGSFIEEQAEKLGCALEEIAPRTAGRRAPISSDRCTVFMERDINHYLNDGYSVDEVLASVLHSVCENYLSKVAIESQIGDTVLFQGATAKNRSLVAAFEQRLGKPIHVSKFCHLAGAYGIALALAERRPAASSFRGIRLCEKPIAVESEVCPLCTNHCKISLAEVDGEKVAYGFLCGRDYDTRKFVDNNPSGIDLLRIRKKAYAFRRLPIRHPGITIAIPAALHLYEDLPFWKYFFNELGIHTESSESYRSAVREGKSLAGAEFCAPIAALHGHVRYLLRKGKTHGGTRYLFIPCYLEQGPIQSGTRQQYCYYTQYAPALVLDLAERLGIPEEHILAPLTHYRYHSFHTKAQLYRMLSKITESRIGFLEVSAAFDRALDFQSSVRDKLRALYEKETAKSDELHVVLLGRPYSVLTESMNKRIPNIFASLGVKVFYQDMLRTPEDTSPPIRDLLDEFHWHYAKQILRAAETAARSRSAYPVLVTSFKCTPDSFVQDNLKELMEAHNKPYLVLQLDEHDSSVGYETRIEAAVEAFQNHFTNTAAKEDARDQVVSYPQTFSSPWKSALDGKTLLIPNWDALALPLVAANLRRAGIDARLLERTEETIRKSSRSNSGQCIPLSIIAQAAIEYVQTHDLDPAKTALWIARSEIACNIHLFPHQIRRIFHSHGNGMERASIYVGDLSFLDLSMKLPLNTYFAFMFGGFLRKMACHIRPYERLKGSTDRAVDQGLKIFEEAMLGHRSKDSAVAKVVSLFKSISVRPESKPKVAVFGDLYVRDNDIINQGLVRFIEKHGGEVVTTPYSSYLKMVSRPYLRKWVIEGNLLGALSSKLLLATVSPLERSYLSAFQEVLGTCEIQYEDPPERILAEFGVRLEHTGESMENLLKVYFTKKQYPDLSLFVQTSPAFCCPSLITEAMAEAIEQKTGVPVVSITYDGTGGNKNEAIIPYLKFPRRNAAEKLVQIIS